MHKRTTPKVFAHAKELRRNLTPAEIKLHADYALTAWQMSIFALNTPSEITSWIFVRRAEN